MYFASRSTISLAFGPGNVGFDLRNPRGFQFCCAIHKYSSSSFSFHCVTYDTRLHLRMFDFIARIWANLQNYWGVARRRVNPRRDFCGREWGCAVLSLISSLDASVLSLPAPS